MKTPRSSQTLCTKKGWVSFIYRILLLFVFLPLFITEKNLLHSAKENPTFDVTSPKSLPDKFP